MRVAMESWRKVATGELNADTIFHDQTNRIVWCYRNRNQDNPHLVHRTIGATIQGDGLVSIDAETLTSPPRKTHHVAVHTLTSQSPTQAQWLEKLDGQIASTQSVPLDQSKREHLEWWSQFWNRSWIIATPAQQKNTDPVASESGIKVVDDAFAVTQGYLLQRFKQACSSRGEFPIKFNGSIFNVDGPNPWAPKGTDPTDKLKWVTADFRCWGGQYWFQNTRAMYWPMLASGDFDLMLPLFRMYRARYMRKSGNIKSKSPDASIGQYIARVFWNQY